MQNLNSNFYVYNCMNWLYIHVQSLKLKNSSFQRIISQVKVQQNSSSNQTQNIILSFHEKKQVKIQEQAQNARKNSTFHNYLKHLITTLKQNITTQVILKYAQQMTYDSQLPTRIWNQLIQSNKFTKKMLIMIVGSVNNNYKIEQKINEFLGTPKKYSRAQVNRSQCLFRKIIIETFNDDKLKQIFNKRRIQRVQSFKEYFTDFIEDLTKKCVKKRITKKKIQKILRQ